MSAPYFSAHSLSAQLPEKKPIFSNVSFELFTGNIIALLGVNGAGKTTLLKALGGIHSDFTLTGQIICDSKNFFNTQTHERAKRVVYLGADLQTEFPLSAYDVVQLGRRASRNTFLGDLSFDDRTAIEIAMKSAECWNLRERNFSTLSGGERQLVLFARGLAQEAPVLLCDESFSRLDIHRQSRFGSMIRQLAKEKIFVFVSHDVNFSLEWANRFFLLHEGRLVERQENELSEYFDEQHLGVEKNPFSGRPHLFFKESLVTGPIPIRKKQ